nr:MAG TPA: Putative tail protein [Caudoviricetes sp.]
MRILSDKWKEKVNTGMDVQYIKYADITLKDGTVLNLTSADLWANGFSFEDSVSVDSSFDIGSTIINVLTLSINNFDGKYSDYDFDGAEVICYVGMEFDDGTTEKIRICTATVVEQPEDETVTIDLTCEDNIHKFDRNYSDSKLNYPATRGQIVRDACEVCGVTLQTLNFYRDDYIVQNRPNDEALTFRQVLQWVAQIGCQWMRCDEYGRLCIGWYSSINEEELIIDDLGVLKTQDDSNISLELSSANGILSANNGIFLENDGILRLFATDGNGNESEIKTTYGFTPHHTDVVITGVKVTEYSESSSDNPQTYMVGTEGYVLGISGNKLIRVGDGQTIASIISEKCVGMRFRPFESECPTDVALEAGDSLIIVDRNGKIYTSLLTTTTLKPGSGQKIACNAKSAAKNSSTRYSQTTQAFVAARNMVKQEKTEREKALEEFGKRIDSATGVYTTVEPQENGSKIFYLHDKPTLAESKAIWKMTSEAWGVSTDGGQTWNGGMTVDGDTIVRILNAVGVNANWINAGAITVKDADGNILFQVDMDTKKVIISGDYVIIGGKTATKALSDNLQESKDYSDGKLADYADTVAKSLSGLQAQIDGQIETFFYDYEPSLQNLPASEWTSTEERKKHEGDLFYWKTTGYAYRFMQEGATWKWQLIQDNDISKALAQAEKAQDTADGKRRTFVVQPSPPYDIGDLWSQDGGDILTCVVSRAAGSVYASSDWKKLNKYTDDTVANEALKAAGLARNMTLQLSNEIQVIASDAEGNIPTFPVVSTQATVMYGTQDITDNCSFTITKSDNVTGSWSDTTHIYNVTGLSADNGWVDIKAVYLSKLSVIKRFTISKQKRGNDGSPGRTYMIEPSCNVLKRSADNTISPNFVEFKAYYRDGDSATRTAYKGRFVIEETTDGNTWKSIYTSTEDEDTIKHYLYTILTNMSNEILTSSNGSTVGIPRDVVNVRCKLYASGGTTTLMDMQSVAVVVDVDALTQEDILNFLTNNGQWKGIYKDADGELYISFSAAMGGLLKLGGKNNGNGVLHIYDDDGKVKATLNYNGLVVYENPLNPDATASQTYSGLLFDGASIHPVEGKTNLSDDDVIIVEDDRGVSYSRFNDNGELIFEATFEELYTDFFSCDEFYCRSGKAKLDSLEIKDVVTMANTPDQYDTYVTYYQEVDFRGGIILHKYPTVTAGYNCYIDMHTFQLSKFSSSSERYKILGAELSREFVDNLYNIKPIMARYKDGYLDEHDERVGIDFPMFNADDVDKYFPLAVDHIDGKPENWNERIMIPAMFAMIKSQKSKIDQQEKLINKLCEKLNIE